MLLSKVDPRERLGKRVRVRLQTGAACESLPHDPTEDGRTGTVRRCERRPHALAHYWLVELDRAVARAVGIEQQAVTSPLLDSFYTPDELEVLEDEPAVPERPQLVRGNLRKLGVDLMDATTASRHDDWAAVLQAVRLIQGRAVVTRGLLERMLGQDATAAVPPLVHVVREIGRLISGREVDSLPPDELRVRMRAVLQALDRELKALLSPPDGPSIP